ncbi:MAG: mechanosensitive ion channel family protein, partial [Angustibacter sp.]
QHLERIVPGARVSRGVARVVFWLIYVFFLTSAVGALQIPAVTTFMNDVLSYLPNIIVAIFIFLIAAVLAGTITTALTRTMGGTAAGKVLATVIPALVMVLALFMILQQLQIAEPIVQIAFAATVGGLALALALSFGLGGRVVAERMLEQAYRQGVDSAAQLRNAGTAGAQAPSPQAGIPGSGTGQSSWSSGSTDSLAPRHGH